MATAIPLDPATIAALDHAVASGRFASHDEAIRAGLQLVWAGDADVEPLDPETEALLRRRIATADALTPAERAGIEAGFADVRAGRLYTVDEVFDVLERRCRQDLHRGEAAE